MDETRTVDNLIAVPDDTVEPIIAGARLAADRMLR